MERRKAAERRKPLECELSLLGVRLRRRRERVRLKWTCVRF